MFIEYTELDAIQQYNTTLNHLVIQFNNYLNEKDELNRIKLDNRFTECFNQFEIFDKSLTGRHNRSLLLEIRKNLEKLDSLRNIPDIEFAENGEIKSIQKFISEIETESSLITEKLIEETKIEIDDFIRINQTSVFHSTITIVSLGIILLVISILGGILFIRKLKLPISVLLKSTKEVRDGNLDLQIQLQSNFEFNELAKSFNRMTQTLQKTTISRDYYDSILKYMREAVLVTDMAGYIETVNISALKISNYTIKEIQNISVSNLFTLFENNINNAEEKKFELSPAETFLKSKEGNFIPVLLNVSKVKNKNHSKNRYIFVAHDLTEKKAIEQKFENERKENQIAINEAHEEEKFRIASDLHDGLGQILAAISYSFQNFISEKETDNEKIMEKGRQIQLQIDSAIRETRNIAHNLIPIALKDFGLISATRNLVDQVNKRSNTLFRFEAYNYDKRIDERLEKVIYRIFQEAITNIIKHSNAKSASLQINKYDDFLVIVIEDDGVGFKIGENGNPNIKKGVGLVGMRERVAAFNGILTIDSKPNIGTEIIVEFPCKTKRNG